MALNIKPFYPFEHPRISSVPSSIQISDNSSMVQTREEELKDNMTPKHLSKPSKAKEKAADAACLIKKKLWVL